MASISKFSTAMLSVPNELTVAAANFNFNFSLMKVEAPKEFNDLRDALSRTRRREAEEGLPHITARTLGALFESLIPPIPHLTAAYGKRVSEISRLLESEPLGRAHGGIFSDQAGLDGTSLWAAATSGQAAIAIHLLSCMLARIWKKEEATSLWVELVERRKEEIQQTSPATSVSGIAAIMAAQQIFSREQLATWDASARSWLQTADSAKRLQQTQLMLIFNNIRMPVNACKDPYESVVQAWVSAMTAMERLVTGIPQRVQDGAILLAISAWHLYPNMQVLTEESKDVDQGDELMSESLLTISSYGKYTDKEGVFWSLPLSRMRYYSPPVLAERHLASDTSRISMHEFQIVVLGAVVGQWKRICADEERCCRFIVSLSQKMHQASADVTPWFSIIAQAAQRVFSSKGALHAQHLKLLKLGTRRELLNDSVCQPPRFFGMEYFHILVRSLDSIADRVWFLQRAIETRGLQGKLIIRYRMPSLVDSDEDDVYVFVPTGKRTGTVNKAPPEDQESARTMSSRWIVGRCDDISCECNRISPSRCNLCRSHGCHCSHSGVADLADTPLSFQCTGCDSNRKCAGCHNQITKMNLEGNCIKATVSFIHPGSYKESSSQEFAIKRPEEAEMTTYTVVLGDETTAAVFKEKPVERQFDRRPSSVRTKEVVRNVNDRIHSATIDELEAVISSTSFNPTKVELHAWWHHWPDSGFEEQARSFRALVFAASVYESMPMAKVNIEVIKKPLYELSWASPTQPDEIQSSNARRTVVIQYGTRKERPQSGLSASKSQITELSGAWNKPCSQKDPPFANARRVEDPGEKTRNNDPIIIYGRQDVFEMDLATRFSCVAWFESGEFDIEPLSLRGVMALANGDSIYVASAMLADPCVEERVTPIRRIFGSLGRPEMSLLVPPSSPRLAQPDATSWNLINHSPFDGTFQNCFASTSLHLTFTDFEMPLDIGTRGLRDRQVVLVEAVVSIEDRGKYVGDLDILSMFKGSKLKVMRICSHDRNQQRPEANPTEVERNWKSKLVSLDCWDEFLDFPQCSGIIRAHGNWQARLGAAAAGIQAGKRVLVLPEEPCVQCLEGNESYDFVVA